LRRGRWALDFPRLHKATAAGVGCVLVVENWLGHGTKRAIDDIEEEVRFDDKVKLRLTSLANGFMELSCTAPIVRALFAPEDGAELFRHLVRLPIHNMVIHQLLGFDAAFIRGLTGLLRHHHSICYIHDFYAVCSRVTMIDSAGTFCGMADNATCTRCVAIGGSHEVSRLTDLEPTQHRALFAELLGAATHVVAPSGDAAAYIARAYPDVNPVAISHPQHGLNFPDHIAGGRVEKIILLGAIGRHKGSARLLELLRVAGIVCPSLHFHLIGYTDIDEQLLQYSNITITGPYTVGALPGLVERAGGVIALFLHEWPETFSYTLSEAVSAGLFPVVPDIGAPAERVRQAGFGAVFPFPFDARDVLAMLERLCNSPDALAQGSPKGFETPHYASAMRALLQLPVDVPAG
jgi:glycosyltransferase involved in cell wall biosynthesis